MSKEKLTDEQIIEQLKNEIHRGEWVDLDFIDCVEVKVLKNALNLINRLKEENAELKAENERATKGIENIMKAREELVADVRKETVEKILNDLVGHTFEDDGWTWTVSKEDIQWLADEYKVEIKE